MAQQSPVGDLLFQGHLNRHLVNVDLYNHPQHEWHDHGRLNRMGSKSNDEQQALAEFTKVIKKAPGLGGGGSYLETSD
jgi:hypothetical protein